MPADAAERAGRRRLPPTACSKRSQRDVSGTPAGDAFGAAGSPRLPLERAGGAAFACPLGALKPSHPVEARGCAHVAAGRRGNHPNLEQRVEKHIEPTGQDDRGRERQDPRQENVAHGRPLQP
jgi:hypothetical protein